MCCSAMFQLPNTPKFPFCLRGFFLRGINRPQAQFWKKGFEADPPQKPNSSRPLGLRSQKSTALNTPLKSWSHPFNLFLQILQFNIKNTNSYINHLSIKFSSKKNYFFTIFIYKIYTNHKFLNYFPLIIETFL